MSRKTTVEDEAIRWLSRENGVISRASLATHFDVGLDMKGKRNSFSLIISFASIHLKDLLYSLKKKKRMRFENDCVFFFVRSQKYLFI